MKNFLLGLVVGAILLGAIGYASFLPGEKQKSYDTGFAEGEKKGKAEGVADGMSEGAANTEAKLQAVQVAQRDSINKIVEKERAENARRLAAKRKEEERPKIQNWRVLGGNIAEPITDSSAQ